MTPKFTTPCLIHKNTPELRKKLKELGYEHGAIFITPSTDFVNYGLAVKLKKCGFDWKCDKQHVEKIPGTEREEWDDEECQYCTVTDIIRTPIPTLYAAQKWLREKHNIHIQINYDCGQEWGYSLFWCNGRVEDYIDNNSMFNSYEIALSAGINACLDLISKE